MFYLLLLCLYAADVHYTFLVVSTNLIHTFYPLRCVYWQLIYINHPSCLIWKAADTQVSSLFFSLYAAIHTFYPILACLYSADKRVSSLLLCYTKQIQTFFHLSCLCIHSWYTLFSPSGSVYTRQIHTFYLLSLCLYAADIYVSSFLLCLYATEVRLSFPLRLYAADKHVSTTAVSIGSWIAPFIPTCRVYTQLMCTYHHLCLYRQIIYTFAPCLFLRASEVGFYTLSAFVSRCTHFHVCYYTFDAYSVSVQFMCRFPPFASKPIGCTPIFALVFNIGHTHLFYALQHVTFRLMLCTQARDARVSTPLFLSLYPLPFSVLFISSK